MDIVTYALLNGKIKNYASNVDEWLEENVDPATGYVLDRSLQMENAAAPADMVGDINDDVGDLKNTLNHKADVIYDTASGDIASFPDGADGLPVKDLTVAIEPVQSGTGDPSPTNVRPISGWTGANVTRTGFNVWDEEWELGTYDENGPIVYNNAIRSKSTNYISVIPNNNYFFWRPTSATYLFFYNSDKEYVSKTTLQAGSYNFAVPSSAVYMRFALASVYGTIYNHDICINISDPTKNGTYEPGHVATLPISWQSSAGTVYGGTLDVTSGVLTVDRGISDLGALDWKYSTDFARFESLTALNNVLAPDFYNSDVNAISSIYKVVPYDQLALSDHSLTIIFKTSAAAGKIWLKNSDYTDDATFKSAMSGVQLVYELATPQTYQLTSAEVITILLGQNNIWADCGPSTVEYPCDTKLYIQKINTPTDDDMIADANIASGKYFIINNNLYLSTTAILAGDPIKPGTNCTATNLAAALNAINS